MIPLKHIHVPTPCDESWEGMEGDAQARFCDSCRHRVHNLSEMTRDEAQALLNEAEGRLCVRFVPNANGTPLTRDELAATQPARRFAWPRRWAAALSWTIAVLTAGAGVARADAPPKHAPSKTVKAGHAKPKSPPAKPPIKPRVTHTMGIIVQTQTVLTPAEGAKVVTPSEPTAPAPTMGKIAAPTASPRPQ
ncbi:MAG: hypothetical protein M3Y28_02090 [Armatimonadota bacterium]|nr:hypothetical protein [Armatimonadota bacterium]